MARKDKDLAPPPKYQAKNDAYTGMLAISLLALIGGCVLLFLDFKNYDYQQKPPSVSKVLPVSSDPNAQQPGAGGNGGAVNGGGVNNPGAPGNPNPVPPAGGGAAP